VIRAARAGHHIIAIVTKPNPMSRWPDQMIKVQTTALNASVS
jgi:hypothetical protein